MLVLTIVIVCGRWGGERTRQRGRKRGGVKRERGRRGGEVEGERKEGVDGEEVGVEGVCGRIVRGGGVRGELMETRAGIGREVTSSL